MPDHFSLFDAPRSKGAKAHARLAAQAAAAAERVFTLRDEHRAAVEEARALESELTLAFRDGKPTDEITAKLRAARARCGEPWAERVRGAELAATRARGDATTYAAEHVDELAAELDDDAADACARLTVALEEVQDAYGAGVDVEHRFSLLATASGRDPQAVRGPGGKAQIAARAAGDALTSDDVRQPALPEPREAAFVSGQAA